MLNWLKNNWLAIVFGAIGLIIGYFLNVQANKLTEQNIINAIAAKIDELRRKNTNGNQT